MERSAERILTTHAGSLVRPRPLLELLKALTLKQSVDQDLFDATLRNSVFDVVEKQIETGIDVPTDGEFGRLGFSSYIWQRLEGLEPRQFEQSENAWSIRPEAEELAFAGFYEQYDRQYRKWWMDPNVSLEDLPNVPGNSGRFKAIGEIKYRGQTSIARDVANLKAALNGHKVAEAFITAIGRVGHREVVMQDFKEYYASEEAYRFALADAFHEEYKIITDAGFLLQVDYPNIARAMWRLDATERETVIRSAELSIEALNYALRDIPEESIRFHYCWGSGNTPHTSDPPLRDVLHLILKVKAQAYSIEAANPRHEHEWMVWRDIKLPDGKILIPGLISHQTNVVEHPELVAWRIENFASVIGRENLIAGTDCGFSQNWDAIRVHPEVQWAKLQALTQGAAIASKKLWSRN